MATRGAADVGFFLIGGREFVGDLIDIKDAFERVVEEITGLGAAVDSYQDLGMESLMIEVEGFLNEANDKSVEALGLTGTQVLLYAPVGNVIGRDFIGGNLLRGSFSKIPTQHQLTKVQASWKSSEQEEGVVLAPHTSRTSATAQLASHNHGAAGTNGGVGYVACSALTLGGYTNLNVKIQDSADDSAWATYIDFTNLTAANNTQRKTESSNPDQYSRVLFTWNGSGSGESAVVAVGFEATPA